MSPDQVFRICNTIAMFTWVLLIVVPRWKWISRIVVSGVVMLLSICYAYYISQSLSIDDLSSFGSLEGVMALFTNPVAVLAGWIHYLAFDLMVGWFIAFDSRRKNINQFFIIPCLLLSFMLGPVGLLSYLALRFLITRKYFVDFDEPTKSI